MDSSRQIVERLMMSSMVRATGIRNLAVKMSSQKVELTEALAETRIRKISKVLLSCPGLRKFESKNPGQT